MRSIVGLQTPTAGEIEVYGRTLDTITDAEESRDLRRRWGVMFQGGALFSTLSVAENIQVPLREYYPRLDQTLLDEIDAYKVAMVGQPPDSRPKYPAELLGGMVQPPGLSRAPGLDPAPLFPAAVAPRPVPPRPPPFDER